MVLAFAFAEGTGNDWIAVALVDDNQTSAAVASLGYAAFLAAMTLGRWTGPRLLDRYGRVAAIRGLAVVALIGLLLFVLSPWPVLAFAAVMPWGLGACLGYPVAFSAAADDTSMAAQRVSTVSGIGQLASLGGGTATVYSGLADPAHPASAGIAQTHLLLFGSPRPQSHGTATGSTR